MYSPVSLSRLACVDELITPDGTWDTNTIYQNFFKEEADKICRLSLGGKDSVDKLAWMHTKDGCYSVKSGYWIARDLVELHAKQVTEENKVVPRKQTGNILFGHS